LGNQLSITTNGTAVDSSFNDQNQITGGSYAYDKDGNMVSDASGNTDVYNAWNQLVAVKNSSDTTIASYGYDANGNQITQTESNATTDVYVDGVGQIVEERQGTTVTAQNVWNIDYINDLLQRSQGTTTYYIQHDANFNVTAVTGSSGNVLERYTYDPYGTVTVLNADGTIKGSGTLASSSIGSPYLFQGGRIDPATGLYHFGARDYTPTLGTWIEQEPLGAAYIDGTNLYQAMDANPTSFSDPTGFSRSNKHEPEEPPEREPEPPQGPKGPRYRQQDGDEQERRDSMEDAKNKKQKSGHARLRDYNAAPRRAK
jgi:RHS repeat-associated protein